MKVQTWFAVGVGVLLASISARAGIKPYEIGFHSSVTANESDPGLVIETALVPGLGGTRFSLEDGQSFTTGFFHIWTDETSVNADDRVAKSITATLSFSVPEEDVTFTGITVGGRVRFLWVLNQQFARVEWDNPVTLFLPGDREFTVELTDETFNQGLLGLGGCGATVFATITQVRSELTPPPSSARQVPDTGPTLFLLGGALVSVITGLTLSRRTPAPTDRS